MFAGKELGFTKMLSLYIKPLLVPKGEYIVRKGDIGQEVLALFFMSQTLSHILTHTFDTAKCLV